MSDPRFLVVRLGSLGDIVHTFPAVSALRHSFPHAQITWLTHPRWESLVASANLATEIWATETRSITSIREIVSRIRTQNFTGAIDYQGLWKSAALPLFGGVPKRIGFSSHSIREWGVPILYTARVRCKTTHIAEQNGELSQCAGAGCMVAPFALQIAESADAVVRQRLRDGGIERYILLSPGGGWRSKCWPPERFGQLAEQIRNHSGLRCVVNYGPGEDDLVRAIKSASGNAEPMAFSGTLERLMPLARNACCMVGGDTGPLHLAVALGTPSVSIYGPTDPQRNGPYPNAGAVPERHLVGARHAALQLGEAYPLNRGSNIILRGAGAVRDHRRSDETDPAILKISPDQVLAAVLQLIGSA